MTVQIANDLNPSSSVSVRMIVLELTVSEGVYQNSTPTAAAAAAAASVKFVATTITTGLPADETRYPMLARESGSTILAKWRGGRPSPNSHCLTTCWYQARIHHNECRSRSRQRCVFTTQLRRQDGKPTYLKTWYSILILTRRRRVPSCFRDANIVLSIEGPQYIT